MIALGPIGIGADLLPAVAALAGFYPWHWEQIPPFLPLFFTAMLRTLLVSAGAIAFGTILGLVLGVLRIQPNRVLAAVAAVYVEFMRNIPLLLVIYVIYFGVGYVRPMPSAWAGILALSIFEAAYIAEIFRAGIQSIDRGQFEAARSTGMSYLQTMREIILPQAVRRMLPPLTGQFVSLIKDSSLLSGIAYGELTLIARQVNSQILRPFEVFLTVGLFYFVLCYLLSLFTKYQERRLALAAR